MEHKNKLPLYKRMWFMIVCGVVAAVLLFCGTVLLTVKMSRQQGSTKAEATATPDTVTAEPENTPLPNFHALSFDPDLEKMQLSSGVKESYEGYWGKEYWVDITPENDSGITLFRHVTLGLSFLALPDGTYYKLGEGETGAVEHAVCTDLDMDGQEELLYTYSGELNDSKCAKVGWINLATLEKKEAAFSLQKGTLALVEQEERVFLYKAEKTQTDSLGFYELTCTERLGELLEQSGTLVLVLDA